MGGDVLPVERRRVSGSSLKSTALWTILLVMAITTAMMVRFTNRPDWVQIQESRLLMGTQVDVVVRARSRHQAKRALQACFAEMERIEALMNVHREESQLSRMNRLAQKGWVAPHAEILSLVKRSLEVSKASHGAFDVTLGPLIKLWREARDRGAPPPETEVRAALAHVGYARLQLDPQGGRLRFLNQGMSIDLGGIAKGYALDKGAEVLRRDGIQHALLNAGGDVLVLGGKGKDPWSIGIQDPRNPHASLGVLKVRDMAVVTSGDYERYFIHEGRRYHHILDPRTGYPTQGGCRSVTVVGPQATQADALATAAFVIGMASTVKFLEKWPGVEGVIVDDQGRTLITPGLRSKVTLSQ